MMARLSRASDSVLRVLSSPRIAAAVMLSWILLLLIWIVPFVFYGIPGPRIQAIIYEEPFFLTVYVALLVSTVACILPRSVRVIRRARRLVSSEAAPRFPDDSRIIHTDPGIQRMRGLARATGFHRIVVGDHWVWAVRNRWTGIGTILFHVSFVVIACAAGVLLFADSGFTGEFVLTEGESTRVSAESYITTEGEGNPPEFDVGAISIEPRFHEDVLLFTKLEATLDTPSGHESVSVGNPWHPDVLTNVALTDFGWSLQLTGDAAIGTTGTYVYDLKVFPSGTQDRLDLNLGNDAYIVDVRIFGDYVDRDGQPGSRSFNADDPRVLLTVRRAMTNGEDRLLVDAELLEIGDVIEVPGGSIHIDGVLTHGVFEVTRDPIRAVVLLGLVMALVGTIARLLFPRTEMLVWEQGGETHVYVRSDVYGRQHQIESAIANVLKRRG